MPLTPAAPILNPRLIEHLRRHFNCDFVLQAPLDADDGQGGKTRTWPPSTLEPGGEFLGAIQTLSEAERLAAGGAGETTTHEITRAYIAGIDPTMRVAYGTRTFDIQAVIDPGEQHLVLQLYVAERFRK